MATRLPTARFKALIVGYLHGWNFLHRQLIVLIRSVRILLVSFPFVCLSNDSLEDTMYYDMLLFVWLLLFVLWKAFCNAIF